MDTNAANAQEQLAAIDAFERSHRRPPWGRILTRAFATLGSGWVLISSGLLETDGTRSVFGILVILVTALMLTGVWVMTSSGFSTR